MKDEQRIWNNCLAIIKEKISSQSFHTWFAPIVPSKYEKETLTISIPNGFFYEWLESEYAPLLRDVIQQELGTKGRLSYEVMKEEKGKRLTKDPRKAKEESIPPPQQLHLNPLYTFENFVVWDGNELAQAASLAVAKNPGKTSFNPLVIHSSEGLGKTHLLQATIHEMKRQHKDRKFFYTSAEDFTSTFIKSLRENTIQEFTKFYMGLDMLLIDDIQFMAGKEKTQELFFNIFNHLYQNGKQIVMSSDCPPSDLAGFPRRLLSRFKCGLTTEIYKPNLETRTAIIQSKLEQNNFSLSDDLVNRIAESITNSVREIEGAVTSLAAHASLNKKAINSALVEKVIRGIVENVEKPVFDIKFLQKVVAEYYKVPIEGLRGKNRTRQLATARHVAMYLARTFMPDATLQSIGYNFGRRDHSTVSYGIKAIEDLSVTDRNLRKSIEEMKKMIERKMAIE